MALTLYGMPVIISEALEPGQFALVNGQMLANKITIQHLESGFRKLGQAQGSLAQADRELVEKFTMLRQLGVVSVDLNNPDGTTTRVEMPHPKCRRLLDL